MKADIVLKNFWRDNERFASLFNAVVIGTITESEVIIEQAKEQEGGTLNMCGALDRLEKRGVEQGIEQGMKQGIAQGIERGIAQNKKDIALQMLKKGNGQRTDPGDHRMG